MIGGEVRIEGDAEQAALAGGIDIEAEKRRGQQRAVLDDPQRSRLLTNKKLFCELGSDGMTLDAEGNLYLTGKGVTVFDQRGKQIEDIAIDEPWTANVCFGGKDRQTLFITASKGLYALRMRVKGAY